MRLSGQICGVVLLWIAACTSDGPAAMVDAAGPFDGGRSDTGSMVDAGARLDAGGDAGLPAIDAGGDAGLPPIDAGVGMDAGRDAGMDGGPLPPGVCGDGVRNRGDGEACDDGNTLEGDAC